MSTLKASSDALRVLRVLSIEDVRRIIDVRKRLAQQIRAPRMNQKISCTENWRLRTYSEDTTSGPTKSDPMKYDRQDFARPHLLPGQHGDQ